MTKPAEHPVEEFLLGTLDALKSLADAPLWSMDDATTDRVVVLAARVAAGVAELEARAVGHADTLGRPAAAQCRDLKRWLQLTTNVTARSAAAKVKLAAAVDAHDDSRTALARGEVHAEQVQVIADMIDGLDDDVSADDRHRAESFLLEQAPHHDAVELSRLAREIYVRLDPEGADRREAEALERQERRARAKTTMSLYDDADGMTHGRFSIPALQGAMLRKALAALAAPKSVRGTQGAGAYEWQTPTPHKLGQAFASYVERYPTNRLPKIGGLAATVIVIGDWEILHGKVKAASLDTGLRISHTEFIRLACEAGIVPMWMNADGEALASGRKHRFHTTHQRVAVIVEQRHCQHPGCSTPGYLCHLHHPTPWAAGGETSVRNAQLLCPFHHHRAHASSGMPDYPMRT